MPTLRTSAGEKLAIDRVSSSITTALFWAQPGALDARRCSE
jgi:hypothetical protein